ncbi:LEA type 2 family protein [Zoogloea sp.]|uniref:LEA type 2 family protein n=1 Tax=Zoogloea sp. TaxID=49181 RepID=UPI0035B27F7B
MDRRRFVALALAGALLGGCAGSTFRPLKPEVSVADIRVEGGNLLEQRFLLTLRVTNPNRFEIPVEGLSFTLEVAGEPFARGVGNKPVTIPALGEALVEVKATAGLAGLAMRQFKNLGKGVDKLEYRLKGQLVTGNFGGYDFDQKGELDPARLLRDGRPARPASEQF